MATTVHHELGSVRPTKSKGQLDLTVSSHKEVVNPAQEGPEDTSSYTSRWPRLLCSPPYLTGISSSAHPYGIWDHPLGSADSGGKSSSLVHGWIAMVHGYKLKVSDSHNTARLMMALNRSDEG